MHLNKNMTGLALGAVIGLLHAAWALLVLFGWAQSLMDWIFSLHFINPVFTIAPFSWGSALFLIVLTFVCGYVMGWVFAWIWNSLHRGR